MRAESRVLEPTAPEAVACALCGGRATRRLYTKFDYGIERCRRCGLVYANPRAPAAAILARYSPDYFWHEYLPAVGAEGGRVDLELLDRRHAPMLALIRRAAPHGRRLLEIGAGAGLFLKAAQRAGWTTAGIELSSEGVVFARDRLQLDVRQERAEAMTFEEQAFDAAVMFDVIEHLFDPRAVLQATGRALKPGGVLVVSTPNFSALSRTILGREWAVLSPLEHLYYFTEATLSALLESCGFGGITFERRYPAWGPIETMNHRYTHTPGSWRSTLYGAGVHAAGTILMRAVQRAGRADALIAVARTAHAAREPSRRAYGT